MSVHNVIDMKRYISQQRDTTVSFADPCRHGKGDRRFVSIEMLCTASGILVRSEPLHGPTNTKVWTHAPISRWLNSQYYFTVLIVVLATGQIALKTVKTMAIRRDRIHERLVDSSPMKGVNIPPTAKSHDVRFHSQEFFNETV